MTQNEFEIDRLADLDDFFDKIAGVKMQADWSKRMSEVIVSGPTYWEVFRVVD